MAYESFGLTGEVRRLAGLLVSGKYAEHCAGHQPLGADETVPRLVWVVVPPVVGTDARNTVNEKRQVQLRPFREGVLTMVQGLYDLVRPLRFVGTRHVGCNVRDDERDVVAERSNGWWEDVPGGAYER